MTIPSYDQPATVAMPEKPAALSSSALLAALYEWRRAEVHQAAVILGMREADENQKASAKNILDLRTHELRMRADEYFAANKEICDK